MVSYVDFKNVDPTVSTKDGAKNMSKTQKYSKVSEMGSKKTLKQIVTGMKFINRIIRG